MDNIQNCLTCKNKKTGEITICSSMCPNSPYEEENGMYICEGNEKCNRSVLYRVEQADLDKLDKYARRFELSGRRLYIYENGITLLDVRPFVKDGKAVIPKLISSIDEEAKGDLKQITSLEVPPSLIDVNGLIYECSENLTKLIFAEDFKKILLCALPHYKNLKEIYLPKSLEKIDDGDLYVDLIKTLFEGKTFYVHEGSYAEEYMKSKGLDHICI